MRGPGPLEAAVIDGLWNAEAPLPVRGVLGGADLPGAARVHIDVMDNLHGKGCIERSKQTSAYLYRPRVGARRPRTRSDTC